MEGLSAAQAEGREQNLEEAIQKHMVAKVKRGLASIEHVYKLYKNGSIDQLIVTCKKEPCPVMRDAFLFCEGTSHAHFEAQEIDDMFRYNLEMFVLKHLDDYSEGITKEEYEQGIKDGRIVVIKCKHLDALL